MKTLILTEGGKKIGFGHITRCVALYEAIEEKGHSPELIINADDNVSDFVKGNNCRRFNWVAEQEKIMGLISNADFVIIDSYLAPKSLYDKISEITNGNMLMVDDYKRLKYPRGIVVNPSIYGEKLNYSQTEGTTYLLGKEYIILRSEFWEVPEKSINRKIKNVLITFGGVCKKSLMDRIISSLKDNFEFNIYIADGDSNKLSAKQMLKIMLKADICISGGGQTTYELARVGVPTIGVCFAENQRMNLRGWKEAGFLEYAGWHDNENLIKDVVDRFNGMRSFDVRSEISIIGRNNVDGQGAERVIALLSAKASAK